MIISHKYKFIFIKTQKTAGTSIEVYLSQHCSKNDTLTPFDNLIPNHQPRNYQGFFNPIPELILTRGDKWKRVLRHFLQFRKYKNHIKAFRLRSRISRKTWNNYYKFCVDRNPWDIAISHYYFFTEKFQKNLSLDEYLKQGHCILNYRAYTEYNNPNEIIVDRIIRYEHLLDELDEVFNLLGIPFNGSLGIRAKGNYRKDRRHYQEVLTNQQRDRITELYAQAIELLGYRF